VKLFDISAEWQEIQEALEAGAGEMTPELEIKLDGLLVAAPEKIEAAASVVKHLEAQAEAAKAEIERMALRRQAFVNGADQLRAKMLPAVQAVGKVKTPRFSIYTTERKTQAFEVKPGVSIAELPDKFVRWLDPQLNKSALKDALKAGEALPDEVLVSEGTTTSLTIR